MEVNPGHGVNPGLEGSLSPGSNPSREVVRGRGANPGHGAQAWPQSPSRAVMGSWPGAAGDPSVLVTVCLG